MQTRKLNKAFKANSWSIYLLFYSIHCSCKCPLWRVWRRSHCWTTWGCDIDRRDTVAMPPHLLNGTFPIKQKSGCVHYWKVGRSLHNSPYQKVGWHSTCQSHRPLSIAGLWGCNSLQKEKVKVRKPGTKSLCSFSCPHSFSKWIHYLRPSHLLTVLFC